MTLQREENQRTKERLAQAQRDAHDSARAMHAELTRLRAEAGELEERANRVAAKKAADAAVMAANRDPEKGLTQLEFFQNVGWATPASAMQTLVWAAIHGDDATLIAGIAMTEGAWKKASDLLAQLPEGGREKYPTPESLAALILTNQILKESAAELQGTTMLDAQHAVVSGRTVAGGKTTNFPMQLGTGGWQMIIPDKAIDALKKQMSQTVGQKN